MFALHTGRWQGEEALVPTIAEARTLSVSGIVSRNNGFRAHATAALWRYWILVRDLDGVRQSMTYSLGIGTGSVDALKLSAEVFLSQNSPTVFA